MHLEQLLYIHALLTKRVKKDVNEKRCFSTTKYDDYIFMIFPRVLISNFEKLSAPIKFIQRFKVFKFETFTIISSTVSSEVSEYKLVEKITAEMNIVRERMQSNHCFSTKIKNDIRNHNNNDNNNTNDAYVNRLQT